MLALLGVSVLLFATALLFLSGGEAGSLWRRTPLPLDPSRPFVLAVVAIFKNEAMGIREWVEHYQWQGADYIILLDNNSTDDWRSALQGVKGMGERVFVLPAPAIHKQSDHYNELAKPLMSLLGVTAVAVLDLDEFLFAAEMGSTVKGLLWKAFAPGTTSIVTCPWEMFGSSGHVAQPKSVREDFTWRKTGVETTGKSIVVLRDLEYFVIHVHKMKGKVRGSDDLRQQDSITQCPKGLLLYHYTIQSRQYYEAVKMSRGAADGPAHDHVRTWPYFDSHDHKDYEDFTLKNLVRLRREANVLLESSDASAA
jgi:hypothetical protein